MSDRIYVSGVWPGKIELTRGWARATARPWNDEEGVAVRLHRGTADFLRAVALRADGFDPGRVYSPALYPGSTRVWQRVGFSPVARLGVMERPLGRAIPEPGVDATVEPDPDWDQITALDGEAFEGWWRMGRDGLEEAMAATTRAAVLTVRTGVALVGYALVGAQMDVAFLQRVAVTPSAGGRGVGTSLVRHALYWGRRQRARVMVLNVRSENDRARRLYGREGFEDTGGSLVVLRFDG